MLWIGIVPPAIGDNSGIKRTISKLKLLIDKCLKILKIKSYLELGKEAQGDQSIMERGEREVQRAACKEARRICKIFCKEEWELKPAKRLAPACLSSSGYNYINDAFSSEKIFTELASLILQIKTKEKLIIYLNLFSQVHILNTELITDSNLVLENITKFASIKFGYITGSTLSSNEVTVSDINDIHEKICYIYENNAIAIQIQFIVPKIPVRISPMAIAILSTKGNESAEQIFKAISNCTLRV
ncbi:hypothetical protein C1645_836132 [Glomus cerebriforme]|uniref:Uncharacterized protein n=1 Tax=Glomus cerebriforme TaxID=658196 RepID=A0A397SB57_9GLOM|nr:hypothetical protein C1645_836132 [Glomus cerebriforme]